jgi:hypothetical protein
LWVPLAEWVRFVEESTVFSRATEPGVSRGHEILARPASAGSILSVGAPDARIAMSGHNPPVNV